MNLKNKQKEKHKQMTKKHAEYLSIQKTSMVALAGFAQAWKVLEQSNL